MTTKTELLEKIAELQAKVDAMPDDIESGRAYEPLEYERKYFFISSDNNVGCAYWLDDEEDNTFIESGNVFLTEQAAQKEVERRKLWQQCRKAMRDAWNAFGEKPDWEDVNQSKYIIVMPRYEVNAGRTGCGYEPIHFPTKESLNAWLSTVTDEQIKLMLDAGF